MPPCSPSRPHGCSACGAFRRFEEMMKMAFVHGKTDQRGFFGVGLGLALFAVFAATGWGLVTLVDEPPQTAAGPEISAESATSEPAGGASAQ